MHGLAAAAQGLHGLHAFAATAQGLHGLQGFAAPDARMAMTVSSLAFVFCSVSDHETAASNSTMNAMHINVGILSDFLEKTEFMTHFLP